MTKKKIWFGNAEKMMWVNCPSTNIRRGRGKWEETGGYLNGGAYAVSSTYSHRKYSIDWNLMESAEAAKIMAFYEGVYGQSPIQFVDPFAAKSNILPLHWSVPRLCAGGEAPTIGTYAPTLVNAPNDQGYPGQSAVFNLTGSTTPSVQIPVPPGKNLYVGARGSATGSAAVSVTTPGGAPVLGRNLASDPRATVSGGIPSGQARWAPRWFGSGGAGTTTAVSGATDGPEVAPGVRIPTYLRKAWTAAGTVGDTGFDHTVAASTGGLPVVAGQVYTLSSHLRASRNPGGGTSALLRLVFHDAAGVAVGQVQQATTPLVAGEWVRASLTATAPAGAALVSLFSDIAGGDSWQPGDTLDGTGLLVEVSWVRGPYFDGSHAPAGYESLWEGAANASTSIYRQRTTVDLRPVTETAQTTMVLNDPGTVTLKLSGTGALTLNSMTSVIGTTPPTYTGFRQGEGNTGLRFVGEPNRTGYSSVLDLESVSAEFLEVGAWE